MLCVCRKAFFSCPLEVPEHTNAEPGKGKGRDEQLCLGTRVRSRPLVALPVRKLGVDKIKAHLESFLRSARKRFRRALLKSCEEGLVLSLLEVEPLSPPAVPNACEELLEQQQSRSVVGEKGVSEELVG